MGFGRRNMAVSNEEAKAYTKYQIGALLAFCKAEGVKLAHVKPHGAFTIWQPKIMIWQKPSAKASMK